MSRATSIDPSWERIGVTGNHPIWSQDRHDYVAAMDLRVGERLKNLSGDTVWVQQKLPRPGPTPVYNLEVQDEHVYYVGTNGVLAHNVDDNCKKGLKPKNSPDLDKWINQKGGTAWSDLDGTMVYKDKYGNIVRYPDGYPDFEGAGFARQKVDIDMTMDRRIDDRLANAAAPLGAKLPTNTWHHHQNLTTMLEVDGVIHSRFTHRGAVSIRKRGR